MKIFSLDKSNAQLTNDRLVAKGNLDEGYKKLGILTNQCDTYGQTLIDLKNAHDTENEFMQNLKKKVEKLRDVLREETSQRDKLLGHAKL